jgi:hypothetical protein
MRTKFIFLAILSAAILSACSGGVSNSNSVANVNANVVSNSNETGQVIPPMSPTEAFKALSEASAKKDVEAIKKRFTKRTLELFDQVAKDQGKTVDQILREPDGAPFPELPDLGEEKIDGNSATLEIGDRETGQISELPFIIEDGEWKIAMDVYLEKVEEALSKRSEELKKE